MKRLGLAVLLLLLLGAALLWTLEAHKAATGLRMHAQHTAPAALHAAGLRATWFGVTAVLLSDGEHAVFIDPFFSRPEGLLGLVTNRPLVPDEPRIAAALQDAGIGTLDAVLVSHSHYDHAMDAGVVARLTGAKLVGSESTANIGRGAGLPERQLLIAHPGQPLSIGSFTVRYVESRHAGATGGRPTGDITSPLQPPARYMDYKLGGAWSILMEHPLGRVLHHGSAGYVDGALAPYQADVVLLGVALIEDLPGYLQQVVDAVGARRVMPTHWDDFTRNLDRPLRPFPLTVDLPTFFGHLAQDRPDIEVSTFTLGQPALLFPAQ